MHLNPQTGMRPCPRGVAARWQRTVQPRLLARPSGAMAEQTLVEPPASSAEPQCPWEFAVKTEQGLREGMEDTLKVYWDTKQQYLYMGCYDGHGGDAAALWLDKELHGAVEAAVKQHGTSSAALEEAFKAADEQLLKHLEELGGESQATAGSTATVALLTADRVVVANVGDSQGYLMRKGNAVALTTPHRVYGSEPEVTVEVKRVKSTGGWVYDGRVCNILAVSRAFGDWEFKGKGLERLLSGGVERGYWPRSFADKQKFTSDPVIVTPATSDTQITKDDEFLVISTDGLWDVFPPREAMAWVRKELLKGQRPSQITGNLTELALRRHTSDNTSLVVVDLQGAEYWKSKSGKAPSSTLFANLFGGNRQP